MRLHGGYGARRQSSAATSRAHCVFLLDSFAIPTRLLAHGSARSPVIVDFDRCFGASGALRFVWWRVLGGFGRLRCKVLVVCVPMRRFVAAAVCFCWALS